MDIRLLCSVIGLILPSLLTGFQPVADRAAQGDCYLFKETGKGVCGRFRDYWSTHGGLAQQGFPISDEIQEVSETDGKTYITQYFERATFEFHPENKGTQYEVLLSLIGSQRYFEYYGPGGAANQQASTENPFFFPQTKHTLGGAFRLYWERHGGLMQQGYPISDEFEETSALDGKKYKVQYFERAVFELHPENAGTQYEVLLSHLGRYFHEARYTTFSIPPPKTAEREQRRPAGSDTYLVWAERTRRYDQAESGTSDLFGIELKTGKSMVISNAPGDQAAPAISGSIAVWEDQRYEECGMPPCSGGTSNIVGKDLSFGTTFTVTAGMETKYYHRPAIAGNSVIWLARGNTGTQLMLKDLKSNTAHVITTWPRDTPGGPLGLAISEEYVAWLEGSAIKTYSVNSGELRGLSHNETNPQNMALSGHHMVWTSDKLLLTDLKSGATSTLFDGVAKLPAIKGDTVVWSTYSPTLEDLDLWGLKLTRRMPMPLVTGPGNQAAVAFAAKSIAWQNENGPNDRRIMTASLAAAFSHAKLAVAPTLPGPSTQIDVFANVSKRNVTATKQNVYYYNKDQSSGHIYAYNVEQKKRVLVKDQSPAANELVSDDRTLIWQEEGRDSSGRIAGGRIQGYDLITRQEFTIRSMDPQYGFEGLTLDRGVLYYRQRDRQLYAYRVSTSETRLISSNAGHTIATDGHVLWGEVPVVYWGGPSRLHVGTPDDPVGKVVVDLGMSTSDRLGSYSLSGDTVTWTTSRSVDTVYLYNITTGVTKALVIPGSKVHGTITWVHVRGNLLLWTQEPTEFMGFSLKAYNLDTGSTTVLVPDRGIAPSLVSVFAGRTIVYLVYASYGGHYPLYMIDVPPDG